MNTSIRCLGGVLSAATLLALALSGCLDSPASENPGAEGGTAWDGEERLPLVHRADGTILSAEAYPGDLPVLQQKYVADRSAVEPTIGIGPTGSAFYIGKSDERAWGWPQVLRSQDQGESWDVVTADVAAGVGDMPPFTGDPFLHVDPETGRVFVYHQQAFVACGHWAISEDRGESWWTRNTCDDSSYGDHPSITTGTPGVSTLEDYPNVVYFCATIDGDAQCRVSLDGGYSFGAPSMAVEPCPDRNGDKGAPWMGHVKTGPDGNVYVGNLACHTARIGISHDDGATWKTVIVDETAWTEPRTSAVLDHEANVGIDRAGNVYYAFIGTDNLPRLSVSTDAGETWGPPLSVAPPFVTATNFPTIAAGDEGRVAYFYMGTTLPGGFDAPASRMANATWHGYVTFSLNADAENPVFVTTTVNDVNDPLRRGDCSGRCPIRPGPLGENDPVGQGFLQDGVYDFLDMDIDPATGNLWIALVDVCTGPCADGTGGSDSGHVQASVGVQFDGTRLVKG